MTRHSPRARRLALRAARFAPLAIIALSACLASCAGIPPGGLLGGDVAPPRAYRRPAPARATEDPQVVALREKLAEGARYVLGRKQLYIRGRHFTMDCTGTVLAIYWYAGIDLARDFPKYRGDGVSRVYKTLQHQGLLYSTSHPLTGDIIFWDNTYDGGGDGWDNPLSHMGMVVSVDRQGTISYIHYHIRRGITIDYMNLESPNVQERMEDGRMKVINSPLRMAVPGRPHAAKWLAGQLYRVLGLGYLLE